MQDDTHAPDDEALMAEVCRGSGDALAALFGRWRDPVWAFFRRRVADRSRAEDLMQETFVALMTAAPRYVPAAPFRSYLFGVAYNLLSEERRRARPIDDVAGARLDALPARDADRDAVIEIRRAIARLEPMDREVLLLREFDALSYGEIAAVLRVPVNTVRSRLFRARAALKETLS